MSRDTSSYYSFLVLPPRKRSGLSRCGISAGPLTMRSMRWCRNTERAGGLTPEARTRAALQVASWRAELDAAYTGTPRTSQGIALQPFIHEFNLPRARFEELIDGVEMDLSHARYETFELFRGRHNLAAARLPQQPGQGAGVRRDAEHRPSRVEVLEDLGRHVAVVERVGRAQRDEHRRAALRVERRRPRHRAA